MKFEAGPERGAAQGDALGRAHVQQLDALATVESPGELLGGDLGRRSVGHEF